MKKSVVLLIGLVYIISVVIVGVLGLKMRVYDEVVYVTDIVLSIKGYEPWEKDFEYEGNFINYYYYFDYTPEMKIEIQGNVEPVEATSSHIDYRIADDLKNIVTLEKSSDNNIAIVTFHESTTLDITAQSTDGKKLQKTMKIVVL